MKREPNGSKLAKLVKDILDFFPVPMWGRLIDLEETVQNQQKRLVKMSDELYRARDEQKLMREDYKELMCKSVKVPVPSFDVEVSYEPYDDVKKVHITYRDTYYSYMTPRNMMKAEISEYTMHVLEDIAATIAEEEVDQRRDAILDAFKQIQKVETY